MKANERKPLILCVFQLAYVYPGNSPTYNKDLSSEILFLKVVVVSNNVSAKKVPAIPGLLEYRKDQKKLYLRANKTWSLLPQEKEVRKHF